jgi:DtxR family manganese transport transcriptional regulator
MIGKPCGEGLKNRSHLMSSSRSLQSTRRSARTFAAGHRRTRSDHATETAEDYVEAVAALVIAKNSCRVRDLAKEFGVSHVTVIRTIARLRREGLVQSEPYGPITLTRRGQALARRSQLRHSIVFRFLRMLGVSQATAEIDTEGIEHHVSPETLRCMRRFIGKQD